MNELQVFFETGSESCPLSMVRLNMEATHENLLMLRSSFNECESLIDKIEALRDEAVAFEGKEQVLEVAIFEELKRFGGSREIEARLSDMTAALKKVSDANDTISQVVQEIRQLEEAIPRLSAEKIVLENVVNNEKQSLEQMQASARKAEQEAKNKAVEAGHATNTHHIKIFGVSVYEYKDNQGDVEKARAEHLRNYAKQAMADKESQQQNAEKAYKRLGRVQGQLECAIAEKQRKLLDLDEAMNALDEAQKELRAKKRGGID